VDLIDRAMGYISEVFRLAILFPLCAGSRVRQRHCTCLGDEEGEDLSFEGRVLERAYMLEQAVEAVDSLFRTYLDLRLDSERWSREKRAIKKWIYR